jgi:hypothetical protein
MQTYFWLEGVSAMSRQHRGQYETPVAAEDFGRRRDEEFKHICSARARALTKTRRNKSLGLFARNSDDLSTGMQS